MFEKGWEGIKQPQGSLISRFTFSFSSGEWVSVSGTYTRPAGVTASPPCTVIDPLLDCSQDPCPHSRPAKTISKHNGNRKTVME